MKAVVGGAEVEARHREEPTEGDVAISWRTKAVRNEIASSFQSSQ